MSVQPHAAEPALVFRPEAPADGPMVDALIDRVFGPGRFVKSSERVREFAEFAPDLSVCALREGRLLGVSRMWRVRVGGEPIAFLGPLAVDPDARSAGLGGELVARACAAAEAAGEAAVLLVGDEAYFRRLGFAVAQGVQAPGPVDPGRVLLRAFRPAQLQGPVQAR